MTQFDYLDNIPPAPPPPASATRHEDADDAFARGEGLFLGGDFRAALAAYRDAVRLAPRFFEAHAMIVECLLLLGRLDEAEDLAGALLEKHNRNSRLGAALAQVYAFRCAQARRRGHEDADRYALEAEKFCDIATATNPDCPAVWLRRAEVALAAGHEKSEALVQTCLQQARESAAGGPSWQMETRIGMMLFRWGRLGEAERVLHGAVALSAKQPCPWYWLGRTYEARWRLLKARACYTAALRLDPHYAKPRAARRRCGPLRASLRLVGVGAGTAGRWLRRSMHA